jgi:hypothetical protein
MTALRLRKVFSGVVFVPKRNNNNVLLAYERLHTIKNKKKVKWGYCALNLTRMRHMAGLNGTSWKPC